YMFKTEYREAHAPLGLSECAIAMRDIPRLGIKNLASLEDYQTIISDPEDFFRYFSFLKDKISSSVFSDAFNSIRFSEDVEISREIARGTKVNNLNWVAIHLRAGDILYGPFRYMDRFTQKVCPAPLAERLVQDLRERGKEVLVFGQDNDLIDRLKIVFGVRESKDFYVKDFNETQQAIFDLTLMSMCGEIYGGTSGFCLFPAAIGLAKFVNIKNYFKPDVAIEAIREYIEAPPPEGVSRMQIAFSAWYAYKIYGSVINDDEKEFFLKKSCRYDPENWFYKFAYAGFMISKGEIAGAKEVLLSYAGGDERGGLWAILRGTFLPFLMSALKKRVLFSA
ncbi:MAG: hypothetical protein Q4G11_05665, partial [Gallicola sp.]|nr:hypothetical protein [Gallicola sp.]